MINQPSATTFKIVVTVFQIIASIVTTFRLYIRYRDRRMWWDDFWAFLASTFNIILLVAIWISLQPGETSKTYVITYWFASLMFTCVLWSARLSIAVGILRVNPPPLPMRRGAIAIIWLFGLLWLALIVQKLWVCGHNSKWNHTPAHMCPLGNSVAIFELCTDLVSDFLLVALPLRMLWGLNIPKDRRRLIISLFSSSVLTTIVSIIHAGLIFGPAGVLEGMTAHIEAATSLIVCNLLVVVTLFYRIFNNNEDLESSLDTPPSGFFPPSIPEANVSSKLAEA